MHIKRAGIFDTAGISCFRRDQNLVRQFTGAVLTRAQFDLYGSNDRNHLHVFCQEKCITLSDNGGWLKQTVDSFAFFNILEALEDRGIIFDVKKGSEFEKRFLEAQKCLTTEKQILQPV